MYSETGKRIRWKSFESEKERLADSVGAGLPVRSENRKLLKELVLLFTCGRRWRRLSEGGRPQLRGQSLRAADLREKIRR